MKRARDDQGTDGAPHAKRPKTSGKEAKVEVETKYDESWVVDDFGDDGDEPMESKHAASQVETKSSPRSGDMYPFPADWMLALRLVLQGQHSVYVTGVPGCGKSTLARAIQVVGRKLGRNVQTLTHAKHTAQLVNGQTLHSFISKLPRRKNKSEAAPSTEEDKNSDARLGRLLESIKQETDADPKKQAAIRDADIIILDEANAMDVVDFRALSGLMRHVCRIKQQFAGKQMVVIGDPIGGLPSITSKKGESFFGTKTFGDVAWVKIYLSRSLRLYNDTPFSEMVQRLLMGHGTADDFAKLLARRVDAIPDDGIWSTLVMASVKQVDAFNRKMQDKYSRDVGQSYGTEITREEEKQSNAKAFMNAKNSLGEHFQGPREIELFVGSQVLLISDNELDDVRIRAGTHGCVTGFHCAKDKRVLPVVKFSGYEPRMIAHRRYRKYFDQYGWVYCSRMPLKLAYAVKTYDVQGIGIGRVTLNPDTGMRRFLPYLLTRVTSLSELFLVPAPEGKDERTQLSEFMEIFKPLAASSAFQRQCMRESFLTGDKSQTKITEVILPPRTERALQEAMADPEDILTPTVYVPTDAVSHEEFERLLALKRTERKAKARDPDAVRREKLQQKKRARVDGFEDDSDMGVLAVQELEAVPDPPADDGS